MSGYWDARAVEDVVAVAGEWGRLGSRLRGRGLSAEQVDAVLTYAQDAANDALGRLRRGERGEVVYRELAAAADELEEAGLVSGSAQETWLELVADPSVTAPAAAEAAGQESGLSTPDNQRDDAAPAGGQREGRTVNRSEYEAEILAAADRLDPEDTDPQLQDTVVAVVLRGLRRRPELFDAFVRGLPDADRVEVLAAESRHWRRLQAQDTASGTAPGDARRSGGPSISDDRREDAGSLAGPGGGRTVNRSEYEAEILAAADRLDPADTSGMAGLLREMAVSIRDHQAMAARRAEWAAQDAQEAAEAAAVAEADSAESPAADVACGESSVPVREVPATVVSIGPRSAEQVGYDLAWQAGLGRAEDWRRSSGLPGREASLLTVGEDRLRPSARPPEAASGVRPAESEVEDAQLVEAYSDDRLLDEWPWAFEEAHSDDAGLVDE